MKQLTAYYIYKKKYIYILPLGKIIIINPARLAVKEEKTTGHRLPNQSMPNRMITRAGISTKALNVKES